MPPRKSSRYESLGIWRGLACLSLVLFHSTMQVTHSEAFHQAGITDAGSLAIAIAARSWIGVPIFFVISGYCILATLESQRRKQASIATYVARRARRIYPPYLAALAGSIVAIALVENHWSPGLLTSGIFTVPPVDHLAPSQWLGNLTITEAWRPHAFGAPTFHILPNTWTLGYEEQFYFIAGLMLLAAPQRIFLAAAVVTGVSVVAKAVAHAAGVSLEGTAFDGRWLLFAVGIAVFYAINYASTWQRRAIAAILVLGLLTGLASPSKLAALEPNHNIERFVACAFGLFLIGAHRWDAKFARLRLLKPLAACGLMSYSIYLAHPLVTKAISHGMYRAGYDGHWQTLLVTTPLCLAASMLCATAFYWLVERHFVNAPQVVATKKPDRVEIETPAELAAV